MSTLKERLLEGNQEMKLMHHIFIDLYTMGLGEGNGIPLQYSCLENPRDGGAWWAAIYGVAQSRTRLKRLSSSSSSSSILWAWFLFSGGTQ